jgi:hypothetical protein
VDSRFLNDCPHRFDPFSEEGSLMETITLEHLKNLAKHRQAPTISIYLPTFRAGADVQQNAIRLKNLLRQAEQQLRERDMRPAEIEALLQPAQTLLERNDFWMHQNDGLAVLIAPGNLQYFPLPYPVSEALLITECYYLKPLLPLVTNDGHYFVLALSQNQIRIFEATRDAIEEIELPEGTPLNMEEALALDDPQKQLQMHTSASTGGQQGGIFHGHAPKENDKANIEQYLNQVDMGVKKLLQQQQAPLVLAGVDYMIALYQQASEYPMLVPQGIPGSPDAVQPDDLHRRAWEIVEPLFRQEMEIAIERYRTLFAKGVAANTLDEVVPAAFYARVEALFVATDTEPMWGSFNAETGEVKRHPDDVQPGSEDIPLLDFAASQTLLNGGVVYGLTQAEMPTDTPLAAIYRY